MPAERCPLRRFDGSFGALSTAGARGLLWLCADDIAMVLRGIRDVELCYPIFVAAEVIMGLRLKPSKCVVVPVDPVVVPVDPAATEQHQATMQATLHSLDPRWSAFQVSSARLYLGVFLGPEAASRSRTAPLAKWKQRARDIAAGSPPAAATAVIYRKRAFSVLTYVAGLAQPPAAVVDWERDVHCRLLRLPGRALPRHGMLELTAMWGWPALPSVTVLTLVERYMRAEHICGLCGGRWRRPSGKFTPGTACRHRLARPRTGTHAGPPSPSHFSPPHTDHVCRLEGKRTSRKLVIRAAEDAPMRI